jgi:hypothetical protein
MARGLPPELTLNVGRMWRLIPALMSLLLAGACSSDDDSGDDTTTGGTSGSGGTGLAGSSNGGTSGSAAGPLTTGGSAGSPGSSAGSSGGGKGGNAGSSGGGSVLRGAVSLNVLASSTCSLPAEYIDLPSVAAGHPVTATTKGEALENGGTTAEGNRVTLSCIWEELDSGLFLDATVNIQMGASRTSVNLGYGPLVEGEPGKGRLVASGPILPEEYRAPLDSCTLTAIDIDPTTRSVWSEIKCPTFQSRDSEDICEIGPSYFFFENCP